MDDLEQVQVELQLAKNDFKVWKYSCRRGMHKGVPMTRVLTVNEVVM
jgi:hypothetical protein